MNSNEISAMPKGLLNRTAAIKGRQNKRAVAKGISVWRAEDFAGLLFYRGIEVTHRYPRHWHDELHLGFYTSGSGYLRQRGCTHQIVEGHCTLTPPGEVHENWVDGGLGCSFRSVYIDFPLLRVAAQHLTGTEGWVPEFDKTFVQDKCVRQTFLRLHCATESPESRLQCEALAFDFFYNLILRCSETPPSQPRVRKERASLRRVRHFIEEHFAESISLKELARVADLSPFHLHHVFRNEIGMPPHAYQTQVRVNRAKDLLHRRWTPSQVAMATGFADQSHFTRHFRRLVGVTPGQFRT